MTDHPFLTRRAMLQNSAFGLGALALGDLLSRDGLASPTPAPRDLSPGAGISRRQPVR